MDKCSQNSACKAIFALLAVETGDILCRQPEWGLEYPAVLFPALALAWINDLQRENKQGVCPLLLLVVVFLSFSNPLKLCEDLLKGTS